MFSRLTTSAVRPEYTCTADLLTVLQQQVAAVQPKQTIDDAYAVLIANVWLLSDDIQTGRLCCVPKIHRHGQTAHACALALTFHI